MTFDHWNATSVGHVFSKAVGVNNIYNERISQEEARENFRGFVQYYNNRRDLNTEQDRYKKFVNYLLILMDRDTDIDEINRYICDNCFIMLTVI